jgi:hypothetical protein
VLQSGGLPSLLSGDENKAVFRPGITLSSSQRPIEIRLSFLAPQLDAKAVSVAVEASASSAAIEQSIALYNHRLAQFDQVDTYLLSTGDRGRRPDVTTSPEDYVDAKTGLSRARLTYRAIGPVLSFPWQVRIDYVAWMASKRD